MLHTPEWRGWLLLTPSRPETNSQVTNGTERERDVTKPQLRTQNAW
jgi:hypothetical protein